MEEVIVTLQLPKDLFLLVQKYAKPYIVNDSLSNSNAIKNTSVLNSSLLESKEKKIPSREEVEEEIRRIGGKFTADRVFIYYSTNGRKWPDDWKAALKRWTSYNLEKDQTTTSSKNTPVKCDFSNNASFKNSIQDLIADSKPKEEVA